MEVNEVEVEPYPLWMAGALIEGEVEVGFVGSGAAFAGEKAIAHILITGFTFEASFIAGNYNVFGISAPFTDKGVFVLNKIE
jgi:hypothetical protein